MACNSCEEKRRDLDSRRDFDNIVVNCETYRIMIKEAAGDCVDVYATPCSLPSAVFQIARICRLTNVCTQFEYFEAQIYSDPVETIIDCSFCDIIKRAIEHYFDNMNINNCNNNTGFFGLF